MVERLLVLLVVMVAAVLGMSVETVLDVSTNQSFTNAEPLWESKWSHQVNLILPSLLPRTHSLDGRNSSYPHQIENGNVTLPEGGVSHDSDQGIPLLGASPGVLDPSCLQLLRCQNEDIFYFDLMEIHHADLPERSAVACGHLCLRQRPDASLVMAKLNPYNEQLVCGCGDQEALPSSAVPVATPICSQPCPDGENSCGGSRAVSVYQVDRDREECVAPSYFYHGCYQGEVGTSAIALGPWERWGGGCRARCRALHNSGSLMRLTTAADGTVTCDCGVTKADLGLSVVQDTEGSGWRCPDGEGWCGAEGLTSVYSYSAALRQHPLPSRLILLLLLILTLFLSFTCQDVVV